MQEYSSIYIYFTLVFLVTLAVLGASGLIPGKKNNVKSMPYESGMQIQAHLLDHRFLLRHYLVALIFLVIDIEVIFMYPWAVVAKQIGFFAFYEMVFFLAALLVGFAYVWRKGGLQWE